MLAWLVKQNSEVQVHLNCAQCIVRLKTSMVFIQLKGVTLDRLLVVYLNSSWNDGLSSAQLYITWLWGLSCLKRPVNSEIMSTTYPGVMKTLASAMVSGTLLLLVSGSANAAHPPMNIVIPNIKAPSPCLNGVSTYWFCKRNHHIVLSIRQSDPMIHMKHQNGYQVQQQTP